MTLIITRPVRDAAPLKRRLEALGHEVCLAPLLTIAETIDAPIPRAPYQAVLLTSANGARALAGHPARSRIIALPAITVGSQSSQAARNTGFREVHHTGGNVTQLIDHVLQALSPGSGPLLYLSGQQTSGDIAGSLGAGGFKVDRVILYAAQPASRLAPAAAEAVRNREARGVLLYSPRTARVWTKCIAADNLIPYMKTLLHYCLSLQVAEALPGEWPTVTATSADEEALLERIDEAGAAAARKV